MKARISILSLTMLTLSFSTYIYGYDAEDSFEKSHDKLSDTASSAVEAASQIASDTQAVLSIGIRKGKAQSILFFNKHLSGYSLDAEVSGSHATLTGTVTEDIEKDYAEQLVLSVDGIESVTNQIKVDSNMEKGAIKNTTGKIASTFKDATITASIKTRLVANSNISGFKIKVSTENRKVLLQGEAGSELEKDLIEQIAVNTPGAEEVINQIEITN